MAAESLIGRTLDGRYRVEATLGHGGMGDVYLGRHLLMERRVAVKVLNPDRATQPNAARRFVREAKSAFQFDHPHCIRVTDFGATDDGVLYLVMDYLDGRTVGEEIHIDGPLSPARVARISSQVAAALDHAHGLGLIHRDLKPDNIMLVKRRDDPDFVKVLDFGLAKLFDQTGEALGTAMSISPLTQEGMVFGTPEYMSPEQAMGADLGPPSDIYALGVVAYQMLTGRLPFIGKTFMEVLTAHVKDVPTPPSALRSGIPPTLEDLVMRCLAKDPDRRPASASIVSDLFSAVAATLSETESRVPRAVAASDTMDLESSQLATNSLAAATGPATLPGSAPIHETLDPSSSSTTNLKTRVTADTLTVAVPPPPGVPRPRHDQTPVVAPRTPDSVITDSLAIPARTPITKWVITSLVAVAGLIAAIIFISGTRSDGYRTEPTASSAASPIDAAVSHVELHPPTPLDAAAAVLIAIDAGAIVPAVNPVGDDDSVERPEKTAKQRKVEAHIAASQRAKRAGNTLKQLAEAHEAYTLDRTSRKAALLMGDALVKSGDRVRGCRFLKRSRKRFRDAGCDD